MRDDEKPEAVDMSWSNKKFLSMRWMLTLIGVWMMGLGLWSVFTGEYDGSSSRSGAEIALVGSKARLMGLSLVALGAFPLGVWATNKKGLLWAMIVPLAIAGVFLMAAIAH
jgi:hypothetical protein